MKFSAILLILFTSFLVSAQDFNQSSRSIKAVNKQKPLMEQALKAQGLSLGSPVFIRIFKQEKQLEVWVKKEDRYHLFKSYPICSYSGDLGPKIQTGDNQAPEGFYFVKPKQFNPWSNFHLSFNLGFPNRYDRAHGRTGDFLMVHGACVSIGCYAMTDSGMEEIWTLTDAALRAGQPYFRVHIFPFKMTPQAMTAVKDHRWYSFWQNLKSGYDFFEHSKNPPNVTVKNKSYHFEAIK